MDHYDVFQQSASQRDVASPTEISPHPAAESVVWSLVQRHPTREEAVTLGSNLSPKRSALTVLGRWDLAEPIRLLQIVQTHHSAIAGLAVSPNGDEIVVAPLEGPLYVHDWEHLRARRRIAERLTELHTIAWSPDGQWIAAADTHEQIYIIRTATETVYRYSGGERNYCLRFDATSSLLAVSSSFQGSSELEIFRLDRNIARWGHVANFDRNCSDELGQSAFSPDGRQIIWFESRAIGTERTNWRGDLCLGRLDTVLDRSVDDDCLNLEPLWCVSIDAGVTGDNRTLEEAGYPMGFQTDVAYAGSGLVVCGATSGNLLFFGTSDGRLHAKVPTSDSRDVCSLDVDTAGKRVLVLAHNRPQWIRVP